MSSTQTPGPAAKRRRVDAANAALRKPFRSPMISRQQKTQDGPTPESDLTPSTPRLATSIKTPGVASAGRGGPTPWPATPTAAATRYAGSPSRSIDAVLKRSSRGSISSASAVTTTHDRRVGDGKDTAADDEDGDLLSRVRKAQRQRNMHLVELRRELDMVRQAGRIERQSRAKDPNAAIDLELRQLIEKWKIANRQAAEDLFELIKGRVRDMGGAKAWRETRRQQQEYFRQDFGDGSEAPRRDHERDCREECGCEDEDEDDQNEIGREEAQKRREQEEEEEDDNDEESGFTMVMMLKSLNIDPEILSYDPAEDKWRD
ncbi:putative meiosis protein [Podospora didyma]|uniref:Meiosis protein n=1 Tax=Podospora didyma TaxID=330526 RepID=A0AAE0P5G4_9PEZI|nr:putative meiosis protein [Podospora didyma]